MKTWIYNNIIWYLKQLFPFSYNTTFRSDGHKYVTVWNMWLGRCYNIKEWKVME